MGKKQASESIMEYAQTKRMRLSAVITLVVFLLSSVIHPGVLSAQAPLSPSTFQSITLPLSLAHIHESVQSPQKGAPAIIHVQDAHLNYEAQKNISGILSALHNNYGVATVFIEGADGELNTSLLRAFPLQKEKEKIIDAFMQAGKVSGAEEYAIRAEKGVLLFGIDDTAMYLKNIETYVQATRIEEAAHTYLAQVENALTQKRSHVLSEKLLTFVTRRENFLSQKNDNPLEYTRYLIDTARIEGIDIERFKHFQKLVELEVFQAQINPKDIVIETRALIDAALLTLLNEEETNRLAIAELDFHGARLSPYAYYGILKELTLKHDIDFRSYSNVNRYYHYLSLLNDIDAAKLMEEREKIEEKLAQKMTTSSREKEFLVLSESLKVLQNIMKLQAVPEDMSYLRKNEARFTDDMFQDLLTGSNDFSISKSLSIFKEFYRLAEAREDAFIKKTLKEMKKRDISSAVLLAGGYHSAGLTARFKEHNVSYHVVAPRLTELPEVNMYEKIMRSYDKYFGVTEGERAGTVKELSSINPAISEPEYRDLLGSIIPELSASMNSFLDELLRQSENGTIREKDLRSFLSREANAILTRVMQIHRNEPGFTLDFTAPEDVEALFDRVIAEKIIVETWNAMVTGRDVIKDSSTNRVRVLTQDDARELITRYRSVGAADINEFDEVPGGADEAGIPEISYQDRYRARYHADFDASIKRAEQMLLDPEISQLLNWQNLIDDFKGNKEQAESMIKDVTARLAEGESLKTLLHEWMNDLKVHGKANNAHIKITRFVDDLMSSFSRFQTLDGNGNVVDVDLLDGLAHKGYRVEALAPTEIREGVDAAVLEARSKGADELIFAGNYVAQFIFAGAATRLGLGSMYGITYAQVAEKRLAELDKLRAEGKDVTAEREEIIATLNDPKNADIINVGMGPRQLIQYVGQIMLKAERAGLDVAEVLAKQRIVIHVNGESEADVYKDLIANNFYGLDPAQVYLLVQDVFPEYEFDAAGNWIEVEDGNLYPQGHGYTSEQLATKNIGFTLDSNWNKHLLEDSVLALLDKEGEHVLIGQHRVNDLMRSTDAVLQENFIGFALEEIRAGRSYVVAKMGVNTAGNKGGTAIQVLDAEGNVLLSALAETLESKALTALDSVLAGGHPFNSMRNIRDVTMLRRLLEDGLPIYFEYKKEGLKGEMVSGDETKHPLARAAFIVEGNDPVDDFKKLNNTTLKARYVRKQAVTENPFVEDLLINHPSNIEYRNGEYRRSYQERYHADFDASIKRAEQMLLDPEISQLLNWQNLIDDFKGNKEQAERMIKDVTDRLAQGESLKTLLHEWMNDLKVHGKANNAHIKITRFVDDLMSSFSRFQTLDGNGNVVDVDLLDGLAHKGYRVEALAPTEIREGVDAAVLEARSKGADELIFAGNYVAQFIFAGAATRLGLGSMYGITYAQVAEKRLAELDKLRAEGKDVTAEREEIIATLNDPKNADIINVGMGPRQLIQYVGQIMLKAERAGLDVAEVLAKQRIVIHVNGESEADVYKDLIANNFYGLNPAHVYLLVQDVFPEYEFDAAGNWIEVEDGNLYPQGHGYTSEQLNAAHSAFNLKADGTKHYLKDSVLALLDKEGEHVLIGQHRVNDLMRSTDAVLQENFIGFALEEIRAGRSYVVAKMGVNTAGNKGGTAIQVLDAEGNVLLSALAETLESKALTALDSVLAGGHPFNSMRNIRDVAMLRRLLEDGLPIYFEYKKEGLKGEMVSGDETKHPLARAAFIVEGNDPVDDFKKLNNTTLKAAYVAKQAATNNPFVDTLLEEHSNNVDALFDRFSASFQREIITEVVKAELLKQGDRPETWSAIKNFVVDVVAPFVIDNREREELLVRQIMESLQAGVAFHALETRRPDAPRVALAMSFYDIQTMSAETCQEFKTAYNASTYAKVLVYLQPLVSGAHDLDELAQIVHKTLGIEPAHIQFVEAAYQAETVDYSFLTDAILEFDSVNVFVKYDERSPMAFEKAVQEASVKVLSNRVRVVSGSVENALSFGRALASVRELFVQEGNLADIRIPEFTQEAKAKLGFYLANPAEVARMLSHGTFIADEIRQTIKSKVEEALRSQIIATFA
jgi:hypothetical protein